MKGFPLIIPIFVAKIIFYAQNDNEMYCHISDFSSFNFV